MGTRLRAARLRRGMTLEVLAGLAGLSSAYLSMVENGKRKLDRYSLIITLADALGVQPGELAPGMAVKRDRLAARRKTVGFSQEQLAESLRIDRSTVGRWESGETEPQPWIRPKLAKALQVSADQLNDLLSEENPATTTDMRSVTQQVSVGARIADLRRERNLTQESLAERAGLSAVTVAKLEQETRNPSIATLQAIAKALEVSAGDLIGLSALMQPGHDAEKAEHMSPCGSTAIDSPEPAPDTIVLNVRFDGKEVTVPFSRLLLLRAGASSLVEAFALDQQFDMVHDIMQRPRRAERLTIASPAHLQEILIHLREQWHALVKTDNLLGPRFALAGVLNQISVVEALRSILRDEQRIEVTRLCAKYAESAAWLYEDTDNMTQARSWTSQAMEWAYEGNDERMLAWTIFRRAQQAAAIPDAAQTIGLARAARRNEENLATPTRAAIRVQEAYGHALDCNDQAAQRLLDEAHTWAAGDSVGDAREGHGSYCTPGYIEIQRATCLLATGQPKKAISLYENNLRTLPTVYQRNRAATLARLAVAYAADSQPEQAASTAHAALPTARSAGSKRIVGEIKNVGTELIPYRALPAVAALLDELEAEDH